MRVSLTPELESWISQKVTSGLYESGSEVIRDSLRLLRERDELRQRMVEDLREELALGVEQLDHGLSRPLTPKLIADVKKAGRKKIGIRAG
ncbi:MAG: type II toxin-antitoxin system ParD family antitoxin [Armatimonadetes bacterium]|nr:type II toxin-antitoxin system ParD family antitoxin [Armatimonadota bacterium]